MKKLFSLKETRLYIALALAVQSFAFFIMFIILCAKKKSIAGAFLAVSAMEGGTAAYLLAGMREEVGDEYDAVQDALDAEDEVVFDTDAILEEMELDEEEGGEEERKPVPCEEEVSEEEFI